MSPSVLTAAIEEAFPFLIGFGLIVVVPIIAMMTQHQRRMAEIIHQTKGDQQRDSEVVARLDAIQRELAELRQRQNETILALENRPRTAEVHQRIGE